MSSVVKKIFTTEGTEEHRVNKSRYGCGFQNFQSYARAAHV